MSQDTHNALGALGNCWTDRLSRWDDLGKIVMTWVDLARLGMTQQMIDKQVTKWNQVGYVGIWVLRTKGDCKTR
jgi:hypothetical protein